MGEKILYHLVHLTLFNRTGKSKNTHFNYLTAEEITLFNVYSYAKGLKLSVALFAR